MSRGCAGPARPRGAGRWAAASPIAALRHIRACHRGNNRIIVAAIVLASGLAGAANVGAETLSEQLIKECAVDRGIDPVLMYAVSLVESAKSAGGGNVGPWPWTVRSPEGGRRFNSRDETEAYLAEALERFAPAEIDVGAYQINVHWHGDKFNSAAAMLDPRQNCRAAAQILSTALSSAPDDPVLGVGRYHHWRNEARARRYGQRVLAIAENIRQLKSRAR